MLVDNPLVVNDEMLENNVNLTCSIEIFEQGIDRATVIDDFTRYSPSTTEYV